MAPSRNARSYIVGPIIVIMLIQLFFLLKLYKNYPKFHENKGRFILDDPVLSELDLKFNLDGCYHVYLDVGSNVGIQVRKIYEPEKYVKSMAIPYYDSLFGPVELRRQKFIPDLREKKETVCAVGFEPNPKHTKQLKKLQETYQKCGYFVNFLTETAVSDHYGYTHFFTDNTGLDLGGGILPPETFNVAKNKIQENKNVRLIKLADFLETVVKSRKIPQIDLPKRPPRVLMKMDIEGMEIEVVADLLLSGLDLFHLL